MISNWQQNSLKQGTSQGFAAGLKCKALRINSLSYDKKREFAWLTWTGSTQLIPDDFLIYVIGNSWQNWAPEAIAFNCFYFLSVKT